MTTLSDHAPEQTPKDAAPDRSLPMLVAAGVVVVTVVALVVLFGMQRPPALDDISADPAVTPPASVAWIDHDTDDGCLRTVGPSGGVQDVVCDVSGEVLAWDDRGIVIRDWTLDAQRLVSIDPDSGEQTILAMPTDDGTKPSEMTTFASPLTQRDEGRLTVSVFEQDVTGEAEDLPTIWEVDAPDGYDVVTAAVSPDRSAIALGDNAGRLLLAPVDGSASPRLWTDQVSTYATVVWEGTVLAESPA